MDVVQADRRRVGPSGSRGTRPSLGARRCGSDERVGRGVRAVVFDLDGVLVDSEQVWDEVREQLARERGGRWRAGRAARDDGDELDRVVAVHERRARSAAVAAGGLGRGRAPGRGALSPRPAAVAGGREGGAPAEGRWPLGLASSSNRQIIDLVLELAGIAEVFEVTVSSEEVDRGKPAPDVYLEATGRLGVDPRRAAAVEDSTNGLLAARAAGLGVVAIPNRAFPPAPEAPRGRRRRARVARRTVARGDRGRRRTLKRRGWRERAARTPRRPRSGGGRQPWTVTSPTIPSCSWLPTGQ